jgi:hypothetical protein
MKFVFSVGRLLRIINSPAGFGYIFKIGAATLETDDGETKEIAFLTKLTSSLLPFAARMPAGKFHVP